MYNPNAPIFKDAKKIESYGTGGDTVLAHINPDEAQALRRAGGMSINPVTGLPQFGFFQNIGNAVKGMFTRDPASALQEVKVTGKRVGQAAASKAASSTASRLRQIGSSALQGYLTGGSRGAAAGAVSGALDGSSGGLQPFSGAQNPYPTKTQAAYDEYRRTRGAGLNVDMRDSAAYWENMAKQEQPGWTSASARTSQIPDWLKRAGQGAVVGGLTGGGRGAVSGAISSALGGTDFGQTDIGRTITGALQGYATGGSVGARMGALGGTMTGAQGEAFRQIAPMYAQGINQAEQARKEASAQTDELKRLGQPFVNLSQEMLDRYKAGTLTPQEQAFVDEQLKQADQYQKASEPWMKLSEEQLARYRAGQMTPDEKAVVDRLMAQGQESRAAGAPYQDLATKALDRLQKGQLMPWEQDIVTRLQKQGQEIRQNIEPMKTAANELFTQYNSGQLRPDQQRALDQQRTAAKQQIRSMGITDTSVLASYDQEIDNNYLAQQSSLRNQNLEAAQSSLNNYMSNLNQAFSAELGADTYRESAIKANLDTAQTAFANYTTMMQQAQQAELAGDTFRAQSIRQAAADAQQNFTFAMQQVDKAAELQRNARASVVEMLNNGLSNAIGLNAQGAGFIRDAVNLKLQSDAEINAALSELMGALSYSYAQAASDTGGGVAGVAGAGAGGEMMGGAEGEVGGAAPGQPSVGKQIGQAVGGELINRGVTKAANALLTGGAAIPGTAGIVGFTPTGAAIIPGGGVGGQVGASIAKSMGLTPGAAGAAAPGAAAAPAAGGAAPGAAGGIGGAAATAAAVAATALGAQQAYQGIKKGREGQAAAGGLAAGMGGAYLAGSAAGAAGLTGTLAALGPAGLVAAGVAALAASMVNTKEFGDVALRNYWNAVESGRGIGETPPVELAQGFINFYRTNKNEFPGQAKYGRTGNEDFVYDMTQVINDAVKNGQVPQNAQAGEIYQQVVKPWVDEMGPGPQNEKARAIMDFMMTDLINSYMQGKPISNAQVKGDSKFKIVSQRPVFPGSPSQPAAASAAAPAAASAQELAPQATPYQPRILDEGPAAPPLPSQPKVTGFTPPPMTSGPSSASSDVQDARARVPAEFLVPAQPIPTVTPPAYDVPMSTMPVPVETITTNPVERVGRMRFGIPR